ncbi:ABC transporter substrate-binding protein [Pseudomonas sp. dw_358]|uniref:ABC transporter substrate-binding protein n=1 Tax=Pseudomonas sp. dw_358 TaxID=2720083 RepID=UPI001BD2A8A4|nr:ABC transporter substrate-binding protein [Pseudomonas sp. dw_358]
MIPILPSPPSLAARRLATLLAGVITTVLLSACSPSAQDSAASKTLRIAYLRDNTTLVSLDPFQVYWIEHRVVVRNVVESLTDQDPKTGQIIPWLAASWDVSDDGLAYTFHLRKDVTFSNGARFDAHAVKTAYDFDKAFSARLPTVFGATYLAGYDHAEVLDDFTVRLVLSKPNAGFLQATSTTQLAIMAPESYTLTDAQRSAGAIIGTGPFLLKSYTPESNVQLVKRQGYAWPSANVQNKGDAHIDGVDIRYVPEDSVRNGQFIQGQVDVLWPRAPFSDVDQQLFKSKGATIQTRSLPGPALVLFPNTEGEHILADRTVRLALQKAIDRKTYASTVYNPQFPVVDGVLDVTTPYFRSQGAKLAYDPQGAEKLLDQAGWVKQPDGYRAKNGKRLKLVDNISPTETAGDVLLQDQLRHVGIELILNVLPTAEWYRNNASGKYDLTSTYMTRADPIILQTIIDPRTALTPSVARNLYAPDVLPKAEALFDAGLTATRPEQRAQAYGDLQDLLIDEGSSFPIYERIWQAATARRVSNFHWTAEGLALFNDIELK